jgi:DNA-binding beta-propeller fold protein YncE
MPPDAKGTLDHLAVDVRGHRLFETVEDYKAVLVFDYRTGKLIQTITGIETPHAILYRADINRVYVTDGGAGGLKIFNGETYDLVKFIPIRKESDNIAYDPVTKYLYITNGGGAPATPPYITVVDTTKAERGAEIKFEGGRMAAMRFESSGPRMFVNQSGKNMVYVINRNTLSIIATWPITLSAGASPLALDEQHHRLFVGSHDRTGQIEHGKIVVIDTGTGKELQALPINGGVDDMIFDPATRRIYAVCGGVRNDPNGQGSVDVYEEQDPDRYMSLGSIPTRYWARTGLLVAEIQRLFVGAPQMAGHGTTDPAILEYSVQ